jgi:hypothetical protein
VRFEEEVLSRLNRYVKEHQGSSSSVANMFVDEALRAYDPLHALLTSAPSGAGSEPDRADAATVRPRLTRQRAGRDIVIDVDTAKLPALAVDQVGAVSLLSTDPVLQALPVLGDSAGDAGSLRMGGQRAIQEVYGLWHGHTTRLCGPATAQRYTP